MYGSAYSSHLGNARGNQIMKRFVISKVISKINDNASCLPCFKYNDETFLANVLFIHFKFCRQIKRMSQTVTKLSAIGMHTSYNYHKIIKKAYIVICTVFS